MLYAFFRIRQTQSFLSFEDSILSPLSMKVEAISFFCPFKIPETAKNPRGEIRRARKEAAC
jgi:hypothetical protein